MTTQVQTSLLFVYGSLKRGFSNHRLMARARFVGECRSAPLYELLVLGRYPGLREEGERAIRGELYAVEEAHLVKLDAFEGPAYRRGTIELGDGRAAETYFAVPEACAMASPTVGDEWRERGASRRR